MRIAVSSDERTHLVDTILEELQKRGYEVTYFGPQPGSEADWPVVTVEAIERVVHGEAETRRQILLYTGLLTVLTLLPVGFGLFGAVYGVFAAGLGGGFIVLAIRLYHAGDRRSALRTSTLGW